MSSKAVVRKLAQATKGLTGAGVYTGTGLGDKAIQRDGVQMTREQIATGVRPRVIASRWGEAINTIGRVTETGRLFNDNTWWFVPVALLP